MIRAHGRGGVGHAYALDCAGIIGRKTLSLDAGNTAHPEYPAGGGGTAADDAAKGRTVADALHGFQHGLPVTSGDAASSHGHAHCHADINGIHPEIIAHMIKTGDKVEIVNVTVGAEAPQRFVFRPFAEQFSLGIREESAASDDAAAHAAVSHRAFPAALLGELVHAFTGNGFVPFKTAAGEVARGQAARFVQDIHQHGGTIFGQPLSGDGVFGERLGKAFGRLTEAFLIMQGMIFAPFGVDDDGFQPLGTHDRTYSAASGMAHGTQFAVGKGDTGGGKLEFSRTADGDVTAIAAITFNEFGNGVEIVQAARRRRHEPGGVPAYFKLPPFAFRGHVFHNNGQNAELGKMAAGLSARVGFLDAFGQRTLAAHGNAVGIGAVGRAQQTGREHKFVVRAERCAGGGDFARDDGRGQSAAAQPGVFRRNIFKDAAFGGHVDPEETKHAFSP